MLNLKRAFQNL